MLPRAFAAASRRAPRIAFMRHVASFFALRRQPRYAAFHGRRNPMPCVERRERQH